MNANGPPAGRLAGRRVLIVDDTPGNLAMLVDELEREGADVTVAQEGEEALARADYVQPDLILLDVLMPGIDGFAACRRLKRNPRTRDIPVIFMTALGAQDHKVAGFDAGGIDYVTKPFQMAEVIARVDTHLTLRATQQLLAENNERLQREITRQRRARERLLRTHRLLRESEHRYRLLADLSPDAVFVESEQRIVFANPAAARLYGAHSVDELHGRSLLSLVASHDRAAAAAMLAGLQVDAPPSRLQRRAQRLDGSTFFAALQGVATSYRGRPAINMIANELPDLG